MSVLITGGAGFIGGWLARKLVDRGDSVDIIDDFSRGSKDEFFKELLKARGIQLIDQDLLAVDTLNKLGCGYSTIYHLAARVGVKNVVESPYATLRDNLLLTERMLAVARRQHTLDRFIFASTSEVYAGSLEHFKLPLPTPEDTPIALSNLDSPRSSYMMSKLYGEAMTRHAGVPFTILRPHNIYGPRMGMAHVIPELMKRVYETRVGGELEVFSTNHTRTFCFVDDAIEMFIAAAEASGCKNQVLNVGSQAPEIKIGELAQLVINAMDRSLSIKPATATPGSPHRRCPDMSRMTELAGSKATICLEEGIARTYAWYLTEVFGHKSV